MTSCEDCTAYEDAIAKLETQLEQLKAQLEDVTPKELKDADR